MIGNSSDLVSKLRATLGKMEVALGSIVEAIIWSDANGKVQWSNTTFDRLVERNRFAVLGAKIIDLLPLKQRGDNIPAEAHPVTLALERQQKASGIYEFHQADKTLFLEISWACMRLGANETSAVIAIHDITKRQQEAEELRQHREHLQELVQARTAEIMTTNEKLQQEIAERQRTEEAATLQAQELSETLHQLQKTQAQLIQTEKMSSLGQLVAGVAHEINNPVNFIYGNLDHLSYYTQQLLELINLYQKRYPQADLEIEELIEEIDLNFLVNDLPQIISSMQVGAERIRQIVLTLRNFARLDEAQMKLVNIHEGIDSTLMILQNRLKAKSDIGNIQIIKEYGDLPMVECYAGQLNQVFMNILTNAIDAINSYNSLRSVEEIQNNPSWIRIRTEVSNSKSITVRIADNGMGITEEVQKRLFDPFFTTKPIGQGTGLGLSTSYQIVVDKHKGSIRCVSLPGSGAEFCIEIPIISHLADEAYV